MKIVLLNLREIYMYYTAANISKTLLSDCVQTWNILVTSGNLLSLGWSLNIVNT